MRESGVVCWTAFANSVQRLRLAEKLLETCPKGIDKRLFLTTGTEALEAALRIMRRATQRPFVISFYGQYHAKANHMKIEISLSEFLLAWHAATPLERTQAVLLIVVGIATR